MLKNFKYIVFASLIITLVSFSVKAQTEEDFQKQVMAVQETAKRTAVVENDKLISVNLPIPDEGEKRFNFEWASDGRSVTIISENDERIQINYNDKNEIQSMVLPDNQIVTISWQTVDGLSFVNDAVIGSGNNAISLFDENLTGSRCRDAIIAARDAIIAAGITCAVDPGPGCWAAVAYAGYMTYRVKRACAG